MTDTRARFAENADIASCLRHGAELLQAQGANPFRVAAYRKAAETIDSLDESLRDLYVARGPVGLDALPGIGKGITAALVEMLDTGRWQQLERLRHQVDPAALLQTVPGIGPELAARIRDELDVTTLEGLELACHDGRLRRMDGIGERRAAAVRAAVSELLDHSRLRPRNVSPVTSEPGVGVLLDVDHEYTAAARGGALPTIVPRRLNPDHAAWLPILHTTRGPWHFTALFSNTARAHELHRTGDWVVIYFHRDHEAEGQRTIVTERAGALSRRRVVRGREGECRAWYGAQPHQSAVVRSLGNADAARTAVPA